MRSLHDVSPCASVCVCICVRLSACPAVPSAHPAHVHRTTDIEAFLRRTRASSHAKPSENSPLTGHWAENGAVNTSGATMHLNKGRHHRALLGQLSRRCVQAASEEQWSDLLDSYVSCNDEKRRTIIYSVRVVGCFCPEKHSPLGWIVSVSKIVC